MLGLIAAIFGGLAFSSSANAAMPAHTQATYAYDCSGVCVPVSVPTLERGQPQDHARYAYNAVDLWPHGASARSESTSAPDYPTTYDASATLVQIARAAGTTQTRAQGDAGAMLALAPSHVAANAGTRAGPPRDALGRFTSGAGGESAATAVGRSAHANYANTLGGGNYVFNRALPGSRLRPDAVDYSRNIVRELKPGTPGAISRGWRQVNQYKAYLEELTGQPWTAYVDVYSP